MTTASQCFQEASRCPLSHSFLTSWIRVDQGLNGSQLSFLLLATNVTYNLFFHPLRAFPGPLLYRALRIPFLLRLVRGTLCRDMLALHDRYGPVVRVAPNELAFADPAAWRDIMQPTTMTTATSSSGSKTGAGLPEIGKWNEHYRARDGGAINILSAPPEEHARLRRQMAGGFSERGMRAQEPILQRYVDLLVRRLREGCEGGGGGGGSNKPVDMVQWLNFTVFDLIGDLAFGESFGCLESSAYHPWVRPVTEVSALSAALPVVSHYPLVKKVAMNMLFTLFGGKLEGYMTETKNKLLRRMEVDRADLIQGLLKNQEGGVSTNHPPCREQNTRPYANALSSLRACLTLGYELRRTPEQRLDFCPGWLRDLSNHPRRGALLPDQEPHEARQAVSRGPRGVRAGGGHHPDEPEPARVHVSLSPGDHEIVPAGPQRPPANCSGGRP